MIILIILIIVLLLSFFFINKTLKKKETILEEVKLQENTIKSSSFAVMLEQDDGTYKESDSSSWPTDMKFNSELSGCIDTNGNKIDNSLSFDKENNIVNVSVGETSYCYVYFDIDNTASSYLIENISSEELWDSTLEDDGYRYVGTDPSNYICFGTSDKDTCINDTDKYMYRIIGIFNDENGVQHAKLIKKEALSISFPWNSDYQADVDWNESDLYKGINGSYFLTNSDYPYMQDSIWTDKISTWNYTMTNTKTWEDGGPEYYPITADEVYLHELNKSSKTSNIGEWKNLNTKISLMYASDYALSLGEASLNYTANETEWMHISNNDINAPDSWEWTMSRYGNYEECYRAWAVDSEGGMLNDYVFYPYVVRPVFYLESDVELATNSGNGSINNPYIISE